MKRLLVLFAVLSACFGFGGTITVTSPAKGSATAPTPIKATTSVNFNITGGITEVTVEAKVFRVDTNALYRTLSPVKVTPNTDGKVSGSITLSFTKGIDPEIGYRVEIRAKEESTPTNTYNADQDLFVKPDLTAPKILQFSPLSGAAVKGSVVISVRISEDNLKDWRVQVDNADLPNGEGTTVDAEGRFSVTWDTSGIQFDGGKTISIRVRDTADNETTQNINVTIDRVKPVITVLSPLNNAVFAPGTTLSVIVDFRDANINATGTDVVLRKTDGTFIARIARSSFQSVGSNTFRWVGRVRWKANWLPTNFRIVASGIDRAGNAAATQTVNVKVGS